MSNNKKAVEVNLLNRFYQTLKNKFAGLVHTHTLSEISDYNQPDWNQNDESANNYIQNRTHWVGTTEITQSNILEWNGDISDSSKLIVIYEEDNYKEVIYKVADYNDSITVESLIGAVVKGYDSSTNKFYSSTIEDYHIEDGTNDGFPGYTIWPDYGCQIYVMLEDFDTGAGFVIPRGISFGYYNESYDDGYAIYGYTSSIQTTTQIFVIGGEEIVNKLDNKYLNIDTELNAESENPVQNKVLTEAINKPRLYFILTDELNGCDYVVKMRDGELVSYPKVESIQITSLPIKTSYIQGDLFDTTGLVVSAVYKNGTTVEITNYEISGIPDGELTSDVTNIEINITYTDGIFEYSAAHTLEITVFEDPYREILIDFKYTNNGDGTYTIIDWKDTLNGEPSTECVIPDDPNIIL